MGYVGPHVLQKKTPCRSVTSSRALLGLCCLVLGQSCHVMRLPFDSLKFSHQAVSTVSAALYSMAERHIFYVHFLMASNQIRATQHLSASIIWDVLPWSNHRPFLMGVVFVKHGQRAIFACIFFTYMQLKGILAHFLLFIYILYTKFCATNYSHCLIKVQKVLLRFSFLLFSLSLTILTP